MASVPHDNPSPSDRRTLPHPAPKPNLPPSRPSPAPASSSRRLSKSGLLVSLVFHVAVVGLLAWLAAREGMLGPQLKKVSVSLVREPPPQFPPPPVGPAPEPPKPAPVPAPALEPIVAATPVPSPPKSSHQTAPSATFPAGPTPAAPAPTEMPSLLFEDGAKTVQTSSDPGLLYRNFVEFSLRSRWNRPSNIADQQYVAEIEIAVDRAGHISAPRWKRKSGDRRWDASVMDAVIQTTDLDRPPPAGFPSRLTVRFDVVPTEGPQAP